MYMDSQPCLSIVIPCYNEKDHIRKIVEKVLQSPVADKEIIVVDDCSTDGTKDILEAYVRPLVSRVLYHDHNQGKGAALRTGFQAAAGRIVLVQDADLEYDPAEYARLIAPILEEKADVVYGSRFLKDSRFGGYLQNRMANRVLTFLSNLTTGLKITDMETCYKAFRREIIQSVHIEENRFGFEPEITAKVARLHNRVVEVPISYFPRTKAEGKKIGLRDGVRAVQCILKYSKSGHPAGGM